MNSILTKACYFLIFVTLSSAQIWDIFMVNDEEESSDEIFLDDDEYNATSLDLHKMSSTELKQEQELLQESSIIVVEEINTILRGITGSVVTVDDVEFPQNHDSNQLEEFYSSDENDENDIDDEVEIDPLMEIISEHTVQLYNVLGLIKNAENETREKKMRVIDIFVWSNVSDVKIKDILVSYYNNR